jgi:hypothetical protein
MTLRLRLQISDMNIAVPGGPIVLMETWTTIPALISVKLTWSNGDTSSEIDAVVGNHPLIPKLNPFQRVRLWSDDLGIPLWIGRIMIVKPSFNASLQGAIGGVSGQPFTWEIYARDYMYSLIDNFVQANKMSATVPFTAAQDATYVPIYFGGDSDVPPPLNQGFTSASRFQIISDLVTNLTGQDGFRSVTMPYGADSVQIERNYMRTPQQTVSDAVFLLANEAPWDNIPSGIGFVFRVAPPGEMGDGAIFQYFQRGGLEWDSTQTFGWATPASSAIIPILSFHSEQEGINIFSRSRVLGKGLSSQPSQTLTVPGMEDTWNPGNNQFMVTRETTSYDDILANMNDLENRATTHLTTLPSAFRGPAIGQIQVIGVPQNAAGVVPIPGDVIELNPAPPDLTDSDTGNRFVIDQWIYEWPDGLSTYILNRRPRATNVSLLRTLARRGLGLLTKIKNYNDTFWFTDLPTSSSLSISVTINHQFGVIPRSVQVYACAGSDDLTSNNPPSAILIPNWYYIPDGSAEGDAGSVGVQIVSTTTTHVILNVSKRFGYSAGASPGRWLGVDTGDALRVVIEP